MLYIELSYIVLFSIEAVVSPVYSGPLSTSAFAGTFLLLIVRSVFVWLLLPQRGPFRVV
jgi:hypothetical protein